jgi:hypothetical protein
MTGVFLSKLALARVRTVLVWAMAPLSIVNGQTIVGCGCTGHFEATCHCATCDSLDSAVQPAKRQTCDSAQNRGIRSRSCCCHGEPTSPRPSENSSLSSSDSRGFRDHHCTKIVLESGQSVISVAPHFGGQLNFSTILLPSLEPLVNYDIVAREHVFCFDSGPPPCDIVVTFHRLII